MYKFEAVGKTDIGRKRSKNQDNYTIDDKNSVYVVADGMGGHLGGETASKVAVEEIRSYIARSKQSESASSKLEKAVKYANHKVYKLSEQKLELSGMGTTVSAMMFKDDYAVIAQVGDSRVYLVEPQKIWQLTQDHSLVQEKFKSGLITREEIKSDKMKNIITRSVGFESDVGVDVYKYKVEKDQVFLICCDGLYGMVDDVDLLKIIDEECFKKNNLEAAVTKLIDTANQNGGEDNITAILIKVI